MTEELHRIDALVARALAPDVPEPVLTQLRDAMRRCSVMRGACPRLALIPLGAALALALAAALLPLGARGTTWAEVQRRLAQVPWVHVVAQHRAHEGVPSETWYQTSPPRHFSKIDSPVIPAMTWDYTILERRLYHAEQNVVTVSAIPADTVDEGCLFLKLMDPELRPDWVASVRRTGHQDGFAVFEVHTAEPAAREPGAAIRLWVDEETGLPRRAETRRPADGLPENILQYSIDYPSDGPADIFDLGVPRTAQVHDARPAPDVQQVIAAHRRFRDAFPHAYHAVVARDSRPHFSYVVWRDGPRRRYDGVAAPDRTPVDLALWADRLRRGEYHPGFVSIFTGSRTVEWQERRGVTRDRRGWHLTGVGPVADPENLGWQGIPQMPVRRITSDEPALAGMIGLEFTQFGPAVRHDEWWLNPQRDYLLHRWVWKEERDGNWEPVRTEEILDYARTTGGNWYPALRRVTGPTFGWLTRIEVEQDPQFPEDVFDAYSLP